MNQAMNMIDYTWSQTINSGVAMQGGGQGEAECPLDSEKLAKNREKRRKSGKGGKATFSPSDR